MPALRKYWFLLLSALVAACGGGGGDDGCTATHSITSTPVKTVRAGGTYVYAPTSDALCVTFIYCPGFTLLQAPSGAGVDNLRGIVYWYPQAADEGKTVHFAMTVEGDSCAEQEWDVAVSGAPIHGFTASKNPVQPGEMVTVTPVFDGIGYIQDVGPVMSGVPVTIGPLNHDTRVTLKVDSPDFHTTYQDIDIRVLVSAAPTITLFEATPASVRPGDPITLRWTVDGPVDSVSVSPPGYLFWYADAQSHVLPQSMGPATTTTYTLTATNQYGSSTATVQVVVGYF